AQPAFEAPGAVAVAARPVLGTVFVPALAARVRVLDGVELEELFPVGPLFRERRGAEAGLHPLDAAVGELARVRHVVQIFAAGDGSFAERGVLDGVVQCSAPTVLHARGDQLWHSILLTCAGSLVR